jgi:hypothetical protein
MWRGARTLPSSGDFYYHAVEYKGSMVSFKKLIDGQPLPGVSPKTDMNHKKHPVGLYNYILVGGLEHYFSIY